MSSVAEDTAAPATGDASSGLELRALTKEFASFTAVKSLDLDVPSGSFFALLGPSGCGKTTTLRMVAGLETPTSGTITLAGEDITYSKPYRRPVNTVFQSYALFPHLDIFENVAFGLRRRKKSEVEKQVDEMLELVELTSQARKKPAQLSGGQQQRVALARVLVTKPKALLLDEPLGDLDRLLQLRMRVELRNLQRQLGLMFIHVTHNQEEALSMADRIVVMNDARIQQIADPLTIATRPETELVARFMGDNNIIHGRVTQRDGDRLIVAGEHDVETSVVAPGHSRDVGDEALVAIRAAAVEVDLSGAAAHGPNSCDCEILFVEFLGDLVKLHLSIGSDRMLAKIGGESYPAFRGREGERIRISWKEEDVQLLRA
jgi:spermidine/putrescine transport system ATP-binding protein